MSKTLDELIREHTGRSTRTPGSYKFKQAILAWVNEEVRKAIPGTYTTIEGTDDPEWRGYVKGVQDYEGNLTEALKHHGFKEASDETK